MLRKWQVAAPAVLLVLCSLTACGGDKPTPQSEPTGQERVSPSGEPPDETPTLEEGGTTEFYSQFAGEAGTTLEVTLNKVEYRKGTTQPEEGYTMSSSPERGYYALVSITVKNTGEASGTFNGANFVWVSPDKERLEDVGISGVVGIEDAEAASTTYQPGQKATGTEVFDLPRKGGQLDYEIGQGAAPLLTIKLPSS